MNLELWPDGCPHFENKHNDCVNVSTSQWSWFKASAVSMFGVFVFFCRQKWISYYLGSSCCRSSLLFLLFLALVLSASRCLTVLCSEEREPDMHISLIMSKLKYQSRAPSHLTKAEVMKPRVLKLNQERWRVASLLSSGWVGAKSEAKPCAVLRLSQSEASFWVGGLGCSFSFQEPVSHCYKKALTFTQVENGSLDYIYNIHWK